LQPRQMRSPKEVVEQTPMQGVRTGFMAQVWGTSCFGAPL
jgi:hypothetical protein